MKQYLLLDGHLLGGKAEQLINLSEAGYAVPWFRVIPADYHESIDQHKDLISDFFAEQTGFFSVRSSAMGEDGVKHSFAGQFDTFLFVKPADIFDKVKEVHASVNSDRIKFYKKQNGITGDIKMAVVVQKMIHADVSGVMFGLHPVTQKEGEMLISAVYGVGEGLVSGALNADDYKIVHGSVNSRRIVDKEQKMVLDTDNGGSTYVEVGAEEKSVSSLSEKHLTELIASLTSLNELYDFPQDVEWAIENDKVYILQSRPITNIAKKEGSRIIWDNSNIIESYPGVTTPLTFSFIREMYRVVYEQFSSLLGIEADVLKKNADVYENMLGLLRGRVYYNLRSWYRALALLPGYKLNADFMESMMGVKEKFELEEEYMVSKSRARWMIAKTAWKMVRTFRRLPRDRDNFLAFLDQTVNKYLEIDFEACTPEQLMRHYNTFEKILTEQWNPPLVNDFFAMIYFGVFQNLIKKWIGSDNPHIHNDLLASSNDIISTQPMIQSLLIADEISKSRPLSELFQGDPKAVWEAIQGSEIHGKIMVYLRKFGERCLGELKLETISYKQAPEKYIKIIQSYLNNPKAMDALGASRSEDLRNEAQAVVKKDLKGKFFKRRIFKYFMRKTRELVSNRENLRFERTRGFGIVREIFSAMGLQFHEKGIIENDRDIFYLSKEEIFDYIKGTSIATDLKRLIKIRKEEYARYKEDDFVPERVVTYGAVNEGLDFNDFREALVANEGDITGLACCPGVVRAEVCVVHSPDQIDDLQGRIMVTSSTDPGWVSLFPTAAGILVERGSLLSHSAIVARELGIPCIVAISGLLSRLETGDLVEMDGSSGVVKQIDNGEG